VHALDGIGRKDPLGHCEATIVPKRDLASNDTCQRSVTGHARTTCNSVGAARNDRAQVRRVLAHRVSLARPAQGQTSTYRCVLHRCTVFLELDVERPVRTPQTRSVCVSIALHSAHQPSADACLARHDSDIP
jgi:hypothetical protein